MNKVKIACVLLIIGVILSILLTSCGRSDTSRTDHWYVEQSPITGRYYEIYKHMDNYAAGYFGMSEITEEEYLEGVEDGYVR